MSKVSLFIVEDDELQAQSLAFQLLKAGYQVAGMADSAEAAKAQILESHPDILVVDVELSGSSDGISLVRELQAAWNKPLPVIFTTRFKDNDTLVRAQQTRPISFIVKPFNFIQLSMAIETAIRLSAGLSLDGNGSPTYLLEDSVFIKSDHTFYRVEIHHIYLVEAQQQYSQIHTATKRYVLSKNLQTVLRSLHHRDLIRVHRSYVVNVQHIESISGNLLKIRFPDGLHLPDSIQQLNGRITIGEHYKASLKQRLRSL